MREGSGGESTVDHGWDLPHGVREGLDELLRGEKSDEDKEGPNGVEQMGPFISKRLGIANCELSFNTPNLRLISDLVEKPPLPIHTTENLKLGSRVEVPSLPRVANMPIFPPSPTCLTAGSSARSLASMGLIA